jgi:hypothetical protein
MGDCDQQSQRALGARTFESLANDRVAPDFHPALAVCECHFSAAPAVGRPPEKCMPHHDTVALTGTILNVFAHRFTLESDGRVHLADLGPKGAEAFALAEGLKVTIKGERRPSEVKVTEIGARGTSPVAIAHKKPHHGPGHNPPPHHEGGRPRPHHPDADPALALRAAKAAGWTPKGEPQRRPKHFEVLARQGDGPWTELHVDLEGDIYKAKPLPSGDGKWAEELR